MGKSAKLIITLLAAGLICAATILFLNYGKNRDRATLNEDLTISVSIPPLKYMVERITGNTYPVNVILPSGSSPETYEPTARQLKELEASPLIVMTGLIDFENSVISKVTSSNTSVIVVHEGIELIEGECHHHHGDGGHSHSHGVDPHIWTSTSCLRIIALNILKNLPESYYREEFVDNYNALIEEIDRLDANIRVIFEDSATTAFLIYHPALTYFARDYGLEQIQLEADGKEPSADQLIRTISTAKENNLDKVLYQKEFSIKTVETAARDIGARPVEIDPLAEDILTNILQISQIIAD